MKYKNSTKGFILKKNLYKDTSVFLEIFTLKFGKKSFFIKNFKKSKKINSAFLNIGSEIEFDFSEKLQVGTINEINFIDGFENLDEDNLKYLSYFLGIISKFSPEEEGFGKNLFEAEKFYFFIKKFFLTLKKFPEKFLVLKIFFEIKILTQMGFLADLNKYGDNFEKINLTGFNKNIFNKEECCFVSDLFLEFDENNAFDKVVLEDSTVKFLYFLQINNVEDILNIELKKSELSKLLVLFDSFLIQNGLEKILKILKK